MAAFTTIAAATVAVGSSVAKGIFAGDAAKTAARQAGRFEIEKKRLEEESVARLEQNFLDEVRVSTDIYDRKLQQDNVTGATIIDAAQEGDQRGVSATAGKVKAATDMQTNTTAEEFADKKLQIDLAKAKADETDAAVIAGLQDDRAAAAGVKADALNKQADELEGQATSSYLDAGVSALQIGIGAFGGAAGGKNMQGKAADALAKKSGISRADALSQVSGLSRDQLRGIMKTGAIEVPNTSTPTISTDTTSTTDTTSIPGTINAQQIITEFMKTPEGQKYMEEQNKKNNKALSDWGGAMSMFTSLLGK